LHAKVPLLAIVRKAPDAPTQERFKRCVINSERRNVPAPRPSAGESASRTRHQWGNSEDA
jgi:hypothetical protein